MLKRSMMMIYAVSLAIKVGLTLFASLWMLQIKKRGINTILATNSRLNRVFGDHYNLAIAIPRVIQAPDFPGDGHWIFPAKNLHIKRLQIWK